MDPLRILIVDDSMLYRLIVSGIIDELPNSQLVGTAHDGKIAISKINTLKPHLLILDIEMPKMNGLQVLDYIRTKAPKAGAIILSSFTPRGGEMTLKALEMGAFDFIPKPSAGDMEENKKIIQKNLVPMLAAFVRQKEIQELLEKLPKSKDRPVREEAIRSIGNSEIQRLQKRISRTKSKIIAIGVSTGGPIALSRLLPKIPPDIGVPIVIVQHMPAVFTLEFAKRLNSKCYLDIKEAENGEPVQPNKVYIAPGGKQMKIVNGSGYHNQEKIIRITNELPENGCKPSVDYLFRSIADVYGEQATGVIMTGMGSDGTIGLKLMKRKGATIIAQDKSSCVVYGMPKGPIESGIVDFISPLELIAENICSTLR